MVWFGKISFFNVKIKNHDVSCFYGFIVQLSIHFSFKSQKENLSMALQKKKVCGSDGFNHSSNSTFSFSLTEEIFWD